MSIEMLDHCHVGIVTSPERIFHAMILTLSLKTANCKMPIDIYVNTSGSDPEKAEDFLIPSLWDELDLDIHLYIGNVQRSICYCRNFLARQRPDKEYIIWFDDDAVLMTSSMVNLVKPAMKFDVIRGTYNNSIVVMSKKVLAEIGWWDERYDFGWEDVDFYHRLNLKGIEYYQFPNYEVGTHFHCAVNTYNCTGHLFHKQKWGEDANPGINRDTPLIPDVVLYPEETSAFLQMKKMSDFELF